MLPLFADRLPVPAMCRHILGAALIALPLAAASGVLRPAAADSLTVTHVPEDDFPTLKIKNANTNFLLEGTAGNAVIRSRYTSDNGDDGQKIYIFGYQVDLKSAYAVSGETGVKSVTMDLKKAPDLAMSPKLPDGTKFYAIDESGEDKGIDIAEATLDGGKLTVTFATPVLAGAKPGAGNHSLWFGLITTTQPGRGDIQLTTLGQSLKAPAGPSTAAGGKPADNQTGNGNAADADAPSIQVFLPLGPQANTQP